MEPLGLKIRKALSRLNQIDNYLYTKPERDWNYDDLSLVKSFLRTARVEEYNTMEDLKKVKEFFSKPLEEVSAEYKPNRPAPKVGDLIGNTVQGFDHKVLAIQGDHYIVQNTVTGKKMKTFRDNMYKDTTIEEGLGNEIMTLEAMLIQLNQTLTYEKREGEGKDLKQIAFLEEWIEETKAKLKEKVAQHKQGINEAYVPSNIAEFAKRKGVMALVNTVAGWAEKVGKRIVGGTAIGKNYDTLILDMTYQGSEIRINTEYETIKLYDEPVRTFAQFKSVYEENQEEESVNEGMGGQLDEKYFIEVSVRDAREAIDIFRDRYRKADIEMYGSNVYASNTISDIYDLYYDLTSQDIEILDYDIDESDFDDESDDLEEVTNEFSPISYAMKVIKGKSIEDVMKESGLRFVELKSLIDKIQKGLVPSMNEEQYGRSKLQKGFEDAISKETFSKLKGKKVGYFGNTYKVIDSDEYIITLQDDDGDIKTVNLNQFIQKGIIPELKKRIQETIKLGEGMIEEELCAKGKAYRKRRLAAGEKSSAYLSGRAVKVCKGQMSGKKKK
jgi:hypothetical protein